MAARNYGRRCAPLKTTAEAVMPYLDEFKISNVKIVHLDLRFMSALKGLSLVDCTVSTVSAACSTMVLICCWMKEGTVLLTPNLRSLTIYGGGLHKLDGSECRHALSTLCRNSSIEWVGAQPNVEILREDVQRLWEVYCWYGGVSVGSGKPGWEGKALLAGCEPRNLHLEELLNHFKLLKMKLTFPLQDSLFLYVPVGPGQLPKMAQQQQLPVRLAMQKLQTPFLIHLSDVSQTSICFGIQH